MSVQANINQMLSLAGILASQNPSLQAAVKRKSELSRLNKKEKALRTAIAATGANIAAKEPYGEQLSDVKKKQFELNPTDETFKAYEDITPKRVSETAADPDEIAKERYENEQKQQEVDQELQRLKNADKSASAAVEKRNTEIKKSREFAKMITEGVPNLSFNPSEYVPPERKEK